MHNSRNLVIGGAICLLTTISLVAPLQAAPPPQTDNSAAYSTSNPAEAGRHVMNMAQEKVKSLLPSFGSSAPDWAKRIEFDTRFDVNGPERFSVLTVQPIWQSPDNIDTIFTQLSYQRYSLYNEYRNTMNAGVGYRRLLDNNNALLGGNVFFDNEFDRGHRRVGFGAEGKWGPLDSWFNYYRAVSGDRNFGAGITERAVNGYDFRLSGQVPYLPWATVHTAYYHWDKERVANNTDGYEISGEFNLHQNLGLEVGHRDDNNNPGTNYVLLRFRLDEALGSGRTSLTDGSPIVSRAAFEKRDLRDQTLTKVRRENRILLERSTPGGGGVTVTVVRG